jgi:hypothetical protein
MRRTLVLFLLGALLAIGLTVGILLRPGHGSAESPDYGPPPQSTFDLRDARGFSGWALYNLGDSFQGYPLVAVLRTHVTNPVDPEVTKIRPNYVSFIYGDCLPLDDSGCAPPLEIQISPACLFTPSDIGLPDSGRTTVRGVNASFYEDGAKLVFVTGNSTVTIYGQSRDQVVGAANAIKGVNVALAAGAPLPAAAVADSPRGPTC